MIETDKLEILLDILWKKYLNDCPSAKKFVDIFGDKYPNDHIAFRTFNNMSIIEYIFMNLGYVNSGVYEFPSKGLNAISLLHKKFPLKFPKIFISQPCERFKKEATDITTKSKVFSSNPIDSYFATYLNYSPQFLATYLSEYCSDALATAEEVVRLDKISEYLSWVAIFKNSPNHFTAKVDNIEEVVKICLENGLAMKNEIEGAPGSILRQTSTKADLVPVELADPPEVGDIPLAVPRPRSYYEICQRGVVEFSGFIPEQASQLFDMTQFSKVAQ